ncbi:hypothetical protein [Pseudomonas xantholysinigenes]|uniref:Uncharacterized protein n=1 Tax=Pseudomonas xantholysinigenes TaxID=2745490 RepID=A0A9E6PYX7_9PSED|nr:hypothetical protein [Pseudomonas xantholysinigenes]QXI39901.1 hypothetical protein HU772_007400 [Pseudomonas xantholysinigenes]
MERLATFNAPDLQQLVQVYPRLDEQVVVPCCLDIRENREVSPPRPRLTLDLNEVEENLPVAVMPYLGMAAGDQLILMLEAYPYEGDPFTPKEFTENIGGEDVAKPVLFKVPRSNFEQPIDLVGCYVGLFVRLIRDEVEIASSLIQNIFIERGAKESHFLRAPHFKDVTQHTLFADEWVDAVALIASDAGEAKLGDSVVVFDADDGVATWARLGPVPSGAPLQLKVPASWLGANTGRRSLRIQYAGANRSFRTHALLFNVESTRTLEDPIASNVQSFRLLRMGYEVRVPISDATSNTPIVVHLGTVTGSGAETVRTSFAESTAYAVRENYFVFYFSPKQLGVLLERPEVKAYYSVGVGERVYSGETPVTFKVSGDDIANNFPRIQVPAAGGSKGLSLARLDGNNVDVKIGAWPLMAPGQLVWIRAYISDRQYDLVKRPVTEDDLKDESIGGSLSYLAIDQQKGKTIRFTCEVNFDNGEGRYFSFTDVDIVITE